jgi:hypothetical protein
MFALTVTAAEIWNALADWMSVETLAARVSQRFDVTPDQASVDVAEFLSQLQAIGALQHREAER